MKKTCLLGMGGGGERGEVTNQVGLTLACSASEASRSLEIIYTSTIGIILLREQTKVAKMPANMHIYHATGIYWHLWHLWQIWWQIWHIW